MPDGLSWRIWITAMELYKYELNVSTLWTMNTIICYICRTLKLNIRYDYHPNYLNNDQDKTFITDPIKALRSMSIKTIKTDIIIDGGNVIKYPNAIILTDKVVKKNEKK